MADTPKWDDTEELVDQTSPSFESTEPVFDETEELNVEPGYTESLARGVAQGATMGFADEATGGLQALMDQLKGSDKTLKESYQQRRDESRAAYEAAREANPKTSTVGELAGGIGSMVIPGMGVAKGAGLAKSIIGAAKTGAAAGLGTSEADLTEGNIQQAIQDVATGGAAGAAFGSAFPLLGKLYKPTSTVTGAALQGAGLTGAGGAIGGAYGALTEDLGTEEGRQAAQQKAAIGAGLAGLSRGAVGLGRGLKATGIGSEFAQDVADAYKLGKEGTKLVGKEAREKIVKEVQEFGDSVSRLSRDVLKSQKQGALGDQLSAAKKLSSKIDDTRKLIGKEIGDVYNNAVNESGDFSDELKELDTFLKQSDLSLDEKASLRNLNKQIDKFRQQNVVPGETKVVDRKGNFGETIQSTIKEPDQLSQGFKPLNVKEYLNFRKEVADIAYGVDTPGSVRKLAKEFYKRVSDKGVTNYLDEQTAQDILPALNKEYSLLTNVDELLGQGKYISAEGAVESGPQAPKFVKNLGEEALPPAQLERTQSIQKTLEEVDQPLLEDVSLTAKKAGKELRDIKEVESLTDPVTLQKRITDLTDYNPDVEAGSDLQKLINQLAKTEATKTKGILESGKQLARKVELTKQVQKEGDKTVFSPRAAAFKAAMSGATAGNLAGQLAAKAQASGFNTLAKALGSTLNKDSAGRNAVLFTIMQNPELRQQYDQLMGTGEQEE